MLSSPNLDHDHKICDLDRKNTGYDRPERLQLFSKVVHNVMLFGWIHVAATRSAPNINGERTLRRRATLGRCLVPGLARAGAASPATERHDSEVGEARLRQPRPANHIYWSSDCKPKESVSARSICIKLHPQMMAAWQGIEGQTEKCKSVC